MRTPIAYPIVTSASASQQHDDPTGFSSNAYWQVELSGITTELQITTGGSDELNQQLENALNNSGVQYSFGAENTQAEFLLPTRKLAAVVV